MAETRRRDRRMRRVGTRRRIRTRRRAHRCRRDAEPRAGGPLPGQPGCALRRRPHHLDGRHRLRHGAHAVARARGDRRASAMGRVVRASHVPLRQLREPPRPARSRDGEAQRRHVRAAAVSVGAGVPEGASSARGARHRQPEQGGRGPVPFGVLPVAAFRRLHGAPDRGSRVRQLRHLPALWPALPARRRPGRALLTLMSNEERARRHATWRRDAPQGVSLSSAVAAA